MANVTAKTSSNIFYKARCEAATHNEQLSSREGAADYMSIDRGRLYRIESGIAVPYPEEIRLMAELQDSAADINPTGKNVAFMYTKDPEKFSLEIPLPFYQYPLQVQKLETEIPCETRTAGLIIYYPLSMLLAYGI